MVELEIFHRPRHNNNGLRLANCNVVRCNIPFEWSFHCRCRWTGHSASKDNPLLLFGLVFIFAAIFAGVGIVLRGSASKFIDVVAGRNFSPTLMYVVICSTIGLPTSLISSRTALGASRNQFIDYSLGPLFILAIGYLLFGQKDTSKSLYVGIAVSMFGSLLVFNSLWHVADDRPAWPTKWSSYKSLWLGIACAILSSLCGALNLSFLSELAKQMAPEVILLFRLAPSGIVLLIIGLLTERTNWRVSAYGTFLSFLLSILIFLFFWILIVLLEKEAVIKIAPFLFLIPLFVFFFSVYPFRTRKWERIPRMELAGMALIIGGLAVIEFGPVWS